MLKEEKVYMPKNKELRAEIVQLHYNVLVAGHGERWKIIELVTRNYWWPEVTGNMEGCNMYQRIKNQTKIPVKKLKLSKVSKKLYVMNLNPQSWIKEQTLVLE